MKIENFPQPIEHYKLSSEIIALTNENLKDYKKNNPTITNEDILCLRDLQQKEEGNFVTLVQGKFFDIVRTNLTLDYKLPLDNGIQRGGLRIYDLKGRGELPPFKESVMMNFIGISGIWVMKESKKSNDLKFFFKYRRKEMSIYSNMLGSTSGYVKVPEGGKFTSGDLMEYLCEEMRREFYEETGFHDYMKDYGLEETAVKIIPLAFTRELLRGGSPQFFYLIKTPYVSERILYKYFRNSSDGLKEFEDSKLLPGALNLSPEALTNLYYCYKYINNFCMDNDIYI